MNKEELREAIIDEIEGGASPEDSRCAREFLAKNPEARYQFEDQVEMVKILDAVEPVAPPGDLKSAVLRSIRPRTAANADSWAATVLAGFQKWFSIRQAYAFAGGLVVGILMFGIYQQTSSSGSAVYDSALSGAMAPVADEVRPLDRARFELEGYEATVETGLSGESLVAVVDGNASREVGVQFVFDGEAPGLLGFKQDSPGEADVFLGREHLQFKHVGRNRYYFFWSVQAETPSVTVKVFRDGLTVEKTLRVLPEADS